VELIRPTKKETALGLATPSLRDPVGRINILCVDEHKMQLLRSTATVTRATLI